MSLKADNPGGRLAQTIRRLKPDDLWTKKPYLTVKWGKRKDGNFLWLDFMVANLVRTKFELSQLGGGLGFLMKNGLHPIWLDRKFNLRWNSYIPMLGCLIWPSTLSIPPPKKGQKESR